MDTKYLAEIKAREQAATKGPWFYSLNGYIIPNDGGEPVAFVGGSGDQAILDCKFISRVRADIPALIDEVERLQNEVWKKELAFGQLTHYNAAKDQQIATLKRALELACDYGERWYDNAMLVDEDYTPICANMLLDNFMKQAKEEKK